MYANPYAVIDLETTGFGRMDRIIEIGVVLLDGDAKVESTWETCVQPNRDIPNTFVHGITAGDLVSAPAFAEIAGQLQKVLQGRTIVAHNAPFEIRFLTQEFDRLGLAFPRQGPCFIDTQKLSKSILDGSPGSLADALAAAGLVNERPHSALADALATAELLQFLLPKTDILPVNHRVLEFPQLLTSTNAVLVPRPQSPAQPGQWVHRLALRLPSSGQKDVDSYRALLGTALVDLNLSATETEQLIQEANALGLNREEALDIHHEFVRQLAVEAWTDGHVSEQESATLHSVAQQLAVAPEHVDKLLAQPLAGEAPTQFNLSVGQRVAFTGVLNLPREQWEAKSRAAGLDVGAVTRKCVCVVAADPDSRSSKAKRARELKIPVIDEPTFARLLNKLGQQDLVEQFDGEFDGFPDIYHEESISPTVFPWLSDLSFQVYDMDGAANSWIRFHAKDPLYLASPNLEPDTQLEMFDDPKGIFLVWKARYEAPLAASVQGISDLRGVGKRKAFEVVKAILTEALDLAAENELRSLHTPAGSVEAAEQALATDLNYLIGLHQLSGAQWIGHNTALDAVRQRQDTAVAALATPIEQVFMQLRTEIRRVLDKDQRYVDMLTYRTFGNQTLEEMGQRFEVTRERARQLESSMLAALEREAPTVKAMCHILSQRYLPLAQISEVAADVPMLATPIPEIGASAGKLLSALSDTWEVTDGFISVPGLDDAISAAFTQHCDEFGVAQLPAVAEDLGIAADLLRSRVETSTSFKYLILGDAVLTKANSIQNRAAGALDIIGEPQTLDQIVDFLGSGNKRSASNALSVDERFIKVSAEKWALAAWGHDEFTSIALWIGEEVDRTGSVSLKELLSQADRFEVAESSIRAYASTGEFVTKDGIVSRGAEDITVDKPLEEAKNMLLRNGQWCLLITVNKDHLRGSGFGAPRALLGFYKVPFLGEVLLTSPLGEQALRFSRTGGAQIATIKRFLDSLGSSEGDRVWLTFGADKTFNVEPAPPPNADAQGWDQVLSDCGLVLPDDAADAQKEAAIKECLGLDRDAARRRAVARFRHRGQDELANTLQGL